MQSVVLNKFIKAAWYEDGQLGLGMPIALSDVASRARLDVATARQCLNEMIQQGMARLSEDGPDGFFIDRDEIRYHFS